MTVLEQKSAKSTTPGPCRWCLLAEGRLVFWNCPDEEEEKGSIVWFNLRCCTSENVSRLPCSECNQPCTFELVMAENQDCRLRDDTAASLQSSAVATTHRLSADGEVELEEWLFPINEMLKQSRVQAAAKDTGAE